MNEMTSNTHRWTWLMIPLPFRMGMTEVEWVLNDSTRPSVVNVDDGGGGLFW